MIPFLPNPLLPSAAALAIRAAAIPCPCVLAVVGHDLAVHAVAGQLAPLVNVVPGTYLLDRPLPPDIKRRTLRHMIRALLGSTQAYSVEAHGHCWQTTLEPIPTPDPEETDPTRLVLGVLSTSTFSQQEAPEDFIDCYTATGDDGPIHAGDVLTCRRSGIVCRTEAIAQRWFDHALARGILSPTDAATNARPASPRRGGRPSLRLLRA